MTDLSDDFENWPRDCFKLFGLTRSNSDKDLRRAYFRLIKKFKPDTHPGEFQRIHEAYESARHILAHGQDVSDNSSFWNDSPPQTILDSNRRTSGLGTEVGNRAEMPELSPVAKDSKKPFFDPADQFWELASKGLLDESVAVMPNITSQRDRDLAGFSEYFLRRASDQRHASEEAMSRIAILLQHLDHPHLGQNAIYYLSNEFECQPELARLDLVEDYIKESAHAKSAHELARTRWMAVGQQSPGLVVADMSLLQSKLSGNFEHTAFEALEYTIWRNGPEFRAHNEACQQILKETHSDLADIVDVLDLAAKELVGIVTAWSPNDIGSLVPKARTGFTSRMEADWRPIIDMINRSRDQSLSKLESLVDWKPVCVQIFKGGLERYCQHAWEIGYLDAPNHEQVQAEITTFLKRNRIRKYNQGTKLSILDFCIGNFVAPDRFGAIADQFVQGDQNAFWSEVLRRDTALNCIYYAGVADQI